MTLITIGKTSDVPEGQARRFEVDGHHIAVVNLGGGDYRALSDVCSHAEAFLHEGEVDPDFGTIECPRHGSSFDLDTGRPTALPATMPVRTYDLTIDDDELKVEIL